jgi:hypothetical protein
MRQRIAATMSRGCLRCESVAVRHY